MADRFSFMPLTLTPDRQRRCQAIVLGLRWWHWWCLNRVLLSCLLVVLVIVIVIVMVVVLAYWPQLIYEPQTSFLPHAQCSQAEPTSSSTNNTWVTTSKVAPSLLRPSVRRLYLVLTNQLSSCCSSRRDEAVQIADHVLAAAAGDAVAGELSNENRNQNHHQNRKLAFHSARLSCLSRVRCLSLLCGAKTNLFNS